jgi:hypothetical protein
VTFHNDKIVLSNIRACLRVPLMESNQLVVIFLWEAQQKYYLPHPPISIAFLSGSMSTTSSRRHTLLENNHWELRGLDVARHVNTRRRHVMDASRRVAGVHERVDDAQEAETPQCKSVFRRFRFAKAYSTLLTPQLWKDLTQMGYSGNSASIGICSGGRCPLDRFLQIQIGSQ